MQYHWHLQVVLQLKKKAHFGKMLVICSQCNALHWLQEKLEKSLKGKPIFRTCCSNGDVQLPFLQHLSQYLFELYTANTPIAKHFRTHIRKYNSALAFTSLKYKPDTRIRVGLQSCQIQGALYYMAGPLEHSINARPQYAQLFLYDPQEAITRIQMSEGGIPLPAELQISLLQQLL